MFGDQSLAPEPTAGVPEPGVALNRQLHARATRSLLAMCALLAVLVASFWLDGQLGVGASVLLGLLRLLVIVVAAPALAVILAAWAVRPAESLVASIDSLRELYDQARLESLVDPLTGLGNHRAFREELDRAVEASRRDERPVALLLLDLDALKRVNDEQGHARGDEILATMGRIVAGSVRRVDRAFRIGGDEFAVLMPGTDIEAAFVLGRRLLAAAVSPDAHRGRDAGISFSAGISACPTPSSDPNQLYRHADAAMYWCKRHGRTMVETFDPARHGTAGDERPATELVAAIADLVERRAMRPVYQPIFDLATGRPIGFEALVRPTADSGFRGADALFAAAESTGRTTELDMACLDVVMEDLVVGPDQYLAVNLSPRTVEAPEFGPKSLLARASRLGLRPDQLVLELTEREAIDDLDRLRRHLDACRRLGIRVAVDDVGAGNAGLRLLSQVEFDIVKIDLSLVQRGVIQESSEAVLRALLELAERWGARIVAEGVETMEQLVAVRELGFGAAQGFLLGRPDPEPVAERVDLDALIARSQWAAEIAAARRALEEEQQRDRLAS